MLVCGGEKVDWKDEYRTIDCSVALHLTPKYFTAGYIVGVSPTSTSALEDRCRTHRHAIRLDSESDAYVPDESATTGELRS